MSQGRRPVIAGNVSVETYTEFVANHEQRLRHALTASLGELGPDAASESLVHAWRNWERVRTMENPVGYLYTVGRNWGRKVWRRPRVTMPPVEPVAGVWVEPGLPAALASLSERERSVVMLLHCFEWTMAEAAEVLGVSKASVQTFDRRGMSKLRRRLGVSS